MAGRPEIDSPRVRAVEHRALEWLQRRQEGEQVGQIADRSGVSVEAVRRATDPYGPFPPPQGSRAQLLQKRRDTWIGLRRAGVSVTAIAKDFSVPYRSVSAATVKYGPYPRPGTPTSEQVESWVRARKAGRSLKAVAREAGVSDQKVADATRPYGPFHSRYRRIPEGLVGTYGLTQIIGVSAPTISAWADEGFLPAPDFVTARGRRLWLETKVIDWIDQSGLDTCPQCGARVRGIPQHAFRRHPDRSDDGSHA